MIESAGKLVHSLVQSAAKRHIEFLNASADRQQGKVAPHRLANQWQGGRIALRIVQDIRTAGLSAVLAWMHVGGASCQQQAFDAVENGAEIHLRADSRDQKRQATG